MTDPKGSEEIPESARPAFEPEPAGSSEPSAQPRDPELEALLHSKSAESQSVDPKSSKKQKPTKTGTSLDRRKLKAPAIVSIALASALVLGGGTFAAFQLLGSSDEIVGEGNDRTTKIDINNPQEGNPEDDVDAVWNEEGKAYPVTLAPWQQSFDTGVNAKRGEIVSSFIETDLGSSAGILPSEAAGFTSDDDQIVLEDGSVNPLYSYWTQESFVAETGSIVEKFINPTYGNWTGYQGYGSDPNSIDVATLFPGVYTDAALANGEPVANWLPIYADWGNNSYNSSDLPVTGPRWYGEVQDSITEFTWDEASQQYNAKFTGNIKYTSYSSSGGKLTQSGVLTLDLVANSGDGRGVGGKVLVEKSSLVMGG